MAKHIGIIGGGPTGLYLLKNLIEKGPPGLMISIVNPEKIGYSTPWSQPWACIDHLSNIGSEEIPDLVRPIHEWLKSQSDEWLAERKIDRKDIHPRGIYPRVVIGEYFNEQYKELTRIASAKDILVQERVGRRVTDIVDWPTKNKVSVCLSDDWQGKESLTFDKVAIATGHSWEKNREAKVKGFFDTPWPITKLETRENHPVGIMGSSLSAVDATFALAMAHGHFERHGGTTVYVPNPGTEHFKIVMHSRNGVLPNLRHHFEFPKLEIYRYISCNDVKRHMEQNDGYLSLDFMFEKVFKESLKKRDAAFYREIEHLNLEEFVDHMMSKRRSHDPFELLQTELGEANESLAKRKPIYWKEMLDDVIYTITFHGKRFSAEDMIRFEEVLMPFFSYISAFMPTASAEKLLALHEAGKLEVCAIGKDSAITTNPEREGADLRYWDAKGCEHNDHYDTMIKCFGQKISRFKDFPFKSLAEQGVVTPAELPFCSSQAAKQELAHHRPGEKHHIVQRENKYHYQIGGIAIDDHFHPIGTEGKANDRIAMLGISHIMGLYPYHPGLAFSAHSAEIAAQTLLSKAPAIHPRVAASVAQQHIR